MYVLKCSKSEAKEVAVYKENRLTCESQVAFLGLGG